MKSFTKIPHTAAGSPAKSRLSAIGKFALTLMSVTMLSCGEKECVEPREPMIPICPPYQPGQPEPDPITCNPETYVTVTNVGCGVGVWGSKWLQLDNGDLLQPWLSNNTAPIEAGQRYRISYAPAVRDNLYDSVITCMALVPFGTPVRINCMQSVTDTTTGYK